MAQRAPSGLGWGTSDQPVDERVRPGFRQLCEERTCRAADLMLSEKRLRIALKTVPLISLDGPFHRFADFWFVNERLARGEGSGVLEGIGARMWGGRFTPPGIFETLYVSLSAETARIEAESATLGPGIVGVPARPFVHFVINGKTGPSIGSYRRGRSGNSGHHLCGALRAMEDGSGSAQAVSHSAVWPRRARFEPGRGRTLSIDQRCSPWTASCDLSGQAGAGFMVGNRR